MHLMSFEGEMKQWHSVRDVQSVLPRSFVRRTTFRLLRRRTKTVRFRKLRLWISIKHQIYLEWNISYWRPFLTMCYTNIIAYFSSCQQIVVNDIHQSVNILFTILNGRLPIVSRLSCGGHWRVFRVLQRLNGVMPNAMQWTCFFWAEGRRSFKWPQAAVRWMRRTWVLNWTCNKLAQK